jgi:hypothetical protein
MSRADRIALLLSILAAAVAYLVTDRVFEHMAHIEDEMAYVWQAQAIAAGHLTVPSPPEPKSFLVPFVIDYNGLRFGKYPLGWPALLAIGDFLNVRSWVNPILSGLSVWLIYRLGKRTLGETVGLLSAGLTISSPFFLMNSGSLLSHPMGLVLTASFALGWLDSFGESEFKPNWLPMLVSAGSLGLLAITRPLTAIAVAIPLGLHGLYVWIHSDRRIRLHLLIFGLIVLSLSSTLFLWQYAVTGDPLLNPYTLWWPYDQVGFGPGHGRLATGHTLRQAYINTRHSLETGVNDLLGWGPFSIALLPFGLWAARRNRRVWMLAGIFPSLLIFYLAYWIGSSLFGPRYYFEGLISLMLLSGAGAAWLAGWPTHPSESWHHYDGWRRIRPVAMIGVLVLLISINLIYYTPMRIGGMQGLYGVERAHLQPFETPSAKELAPATIIVHPDEKWVEYGTLLELSDPMLDTDFIFVHTRGIENDEKVAASFPDRSVYHYYPDQPDQFYTRPRPEK